MVAMDEKYLTIGGCGVDFAAAAGGTQPLVNNLYQGMTLDAVTGLYYARNRNYSPSLGVWISQDPAGYINGANTYQFVASSPVGNVDAGGLDVIVLISPNEAHGFGHAAVIIGSNQTGWDYYSKNGKTGFGLWGGNEGRHEHYKTLNDFLNSNNHGNRYPDRVDIPKGPCKDKAMRDWAKNHVYTPYRVCSANCAALAQGVLQAGGIPTGNIDNGPWWTFHAPIPDSLFQNLVTEDDNLQLGSGVTITTPQGSTTITFQK
jgi:RHS repeat-associated protein